MCNSLNVLHVHAIMNKLPEPRSGWNFIVLTVVWRSLLSCIIPRNMHSKEYEMFCFSVIFTYIAITDWQFLTSLRSLSIQIRLKFKNSRCSSHIGVLVFFFSSFALLPFFPYLLFNLWIFIQWITCGILFMYNNHATPVSHWIRIPQTEIK